MRSRDFVFWLQGVFEVGNPTTFNEQQVAVIKQHLGLVFTHDPEMKAPAHPPVGVTASPNQFPPYHYPSEATKGVMSPNAIAIC